MTCEESAELGTPSDEQCAWSISRTQDTTTIALNGEVDMAGAPALADAFDEIMNSTPRAIVVDLAGLSFIDSSGIRCLLNAARAAKTAECRFVVTSPTPTVLRVLEITGSAGVLLDGEANPLPTRHA
jgi:anti-sigma B factor antagonist